MLGKKNLTGVSIMNKSDSGRIRKWGHRAVVGGEGKFYATFFKVQSPKDNYPVSDAIDCFFYSREQMSLLADIAGWNMQYIGDWGHPRHQKMVKLEPK